MRRRLWSSVVVLDEPLVYTGTGRELLVGFAVVAVALVLPLVLLVNIGALLWGLQFALTAKILVFAAFVPLAGLAAYSARRYRLSRTMWRGRTGGMTGSALGFGWLSGWTAVFVLLSFGWLLPSRHLTLMRRLADQTVLAGCPTIFEQPPRAGLYGRYALLWLAIVGSVCLLFVGFGWIAQSVVRDQPGLTAAEAGELFRQRLPWLLAVVVPCLPLMVLGYAAYTVRKLRLMTAATRLGDVRFATTATTLAYARLLLTNLMITYGTLTALRPVAEARRLKFLVEQLVVHGDLSAVLERSAPYALDRGADGLGQFFDVDLF